VRNLPGPVHLLVRDKLRPPILRELLLRVLEQTALRLITISYLLVFTLSPLTVLYPPPCPYCRQRVTLLLPYFSPSERDSVAESDVNHRRDVLHKAQMFNRRYSGEPRSFTEQLNDLPMVLRHLWAYIWSGEGMNNVFRIRFYFMLAVTVVYLIVPVDLLPGNNCCW